MKINVGLLIQGEEGSLWRVIANEEGLCTLLRTGTEKRELLQKGESLLALEMEKGSLCEVEEQPLVVDERLLTKAQRADYRKKLAFIHDFKALYGPTYDAYFRAKRKKEYRRLYRSYGFSPPLANRLVRRYLQSGMQDASLLDRRVFICGSGAFYNYSKKPGRKSAEKQGVVLNESVREAFEYGLKEYKSGRLVSKREAYSRMQNRYFVEVVDGRAVLLPPDQRPTAKQFMHYLDKHLSHQDVGRVKTSVAEYWNNERLLFGKPRNDALRPGSILEADALELDLDVVSTSDTSQNVSRPVVYMLIDIYSHCIVAFSVGFDNNSMLGLSSLMLNLIEDKEELLSRHSITMDISAWPSTFIPGEIRCDRGSDFASDQFSSLCRELGIRRTLESGAMGSMKPHIERSFGLLHQSLMADFEHLGFIQKRHDSRHKKEACLTIDGVFLLLLRFVIEHNRRPLTKVKLSPEELAGGVDKSPLSFWRYGCARNGEPEPVTRSNRAAKLYALMEEGSATISKEGVSFRGLIYYSAADEDLRERMRLSRYNAGKRDTEGRLRNTLSVRIDPRSIDNIYYRKDGRLMTLALNPAKNAGIADMTWSEYEDHRRLESKVDREGEETRLQLTVDRQNFNSMIAEMYRKETYASTTDIVESRRDERNRTNHANRIQVRLGDLAGDEPPAIPIGQSEEPAKEAPAAAQVEPVTLKGSVFSSDCPEDLLDFLGQ